MAWQLEGTFFEACNCDVVCPCLFLSDPTGEDCTVLVAWHIEKGRDGKIRLDGLNMALAVLAPGNMAQTKWKVAAYVDERADDKQRESLLRIFGGKAGGHPAVLASFIDELVGAAFTKIDFEASGDRRRLTIPDIASVEIQGIKGQGDGPVTVSGHPLCIAPGFPATVAKSTQLTYRDHGMDWSVTEKTGAFSPFAYQD